MPTFRRERTSPIDEDTELDDEDLIPFFQSEDYMNAKLSISELKAEADAAESAAQQAMRERAAAVTRSQEALRAASKARQRYLRASGAQGEGEGNE